MSNDRDVEMTLSVAEFVAKLRELADTLEQGGDFALDVDGETVTVAKSAILSVEHERENGREELEFQLSWVSDAQDDESDEDDSEEDVEADDDEDEAEASDTSEAAA